jgi:hypothetical protein
VVKEETAITLREHYPLSEAGLGLKEHAGKTGGMIVLSAGLFCSYLRVNFVYISHYSSIFYIPITSHIP